MEHIGQLLERGFFGGIVAAAAFVGAAAVLYLVYQLMRALRPKEVRQEEQRIRSHRFYKVSGRGRVAYLILCLEEVLRFYGQDLSAWEGILRELWTITDRSEGDWIGTWIDVVGDLLPSTISTGRADRLSSEEVKKIQDLYTQSGMAMILVDALMENAYTMVCGWSPETVAHDPDALQLIDRAEEMMERSGVPLPSEETVQILASQKDPSIGKPFAI